MKHPASLPAGATRRDFLAASAATAAGAALTALAPNVHAAGGDTLRVSPPTHRPSSSPSATPSPTRSTGPSR